MNSKVMKKWLAALLCVAMWPVSAANLAIGNQAYERGDYGEALEQYRGLAEQGDARAQAQYARMMALGQGMPQDLAGSTAWYEKSAAQGDPQGQYGLAYSYANGEGVPQDIDRAIALLEKSDAQDYTRATNLLGEIYAGLFDERHEDFTRARALFERAAAVGNAGARRNLGLMLINGQGGAAEPERAIALLQPEAADDPISASALGLAYEQGMGIPIDKVRAARWYKISADHGYGPAQINIGKLYHMGDGVERDYAAAARYYRMAAEQGYALANLNLGHLYSEGKGVARDAREAVINYAIAAIDDVPSAQDVLDEQLKKLEQRRVATETVLREAPEADAAGYVALNVGATVWPVSDAERGWVAVYASADGPRLGYVVVDDLN
ncbi:tetratricopeptide repeat protein [Salinisphaera sp. Q1T1-3]|uniref:tetratricopeptide repeat protein n=1 Tax=Salinisphaera sp. Q1T1-3 TaxID=2321229 RepID=UPI001313E1B9|nr:SEL1-like repeat protein [Salinisphaera sp. Q1T1-3]